MNTAPAASVFLTVERHGRACRHVRSGHTGIELSEDPRDCFCAWERSERTTALATSQPRRDGAVA